MAVQQSASAATLVLQNLAIRQVKRTERIFTNPTNRETEDYVSGRFG